MPRKADRQMQAYFMAVFAIAGAVLSLAAMAVLVWGFFNG